MTAEDPYLQRLRVANHEAGHACGHYRYGRPIKEIDIDFPESWSLGHVVPAKQAELMMPPGLAGDAALAWIDGFLFQSRLAVAVCARVGSLFGRDEWLGQACASDRAIVLQTCPREFAVATWEAFVEIHAEELFMDPRFGAAVTALSIALLEHPHDAMPGARAFRIIGQALAEYDQRAT